MMTQRLDLEAFQKVVESTPLVSIDLVVINKLGLVLLGCRTNRPAQGYWFVPGGRIRKDETFGAAFHRLTLIELGSAISIEQATFLGPYEHLYADNFSDADFSTHYVVLAYELKLEVVLTHLPKDQHNNYKWWSIADLLRSKFVHENTKAYFNKTTNKAS